MLAAALLMCAAALTLRLRTAAPAIA